MGFLNGLWVVIKISLVLMLLYGIYLTYIIIGWQWFALLIWVALLTLALILGIQLMGDPNNE